MRKWPTSQTQGVLYKAKSLDSNEYSHADGRRRKEGGDLCHIIVLFATAPVVGYLYSENRRGLVIDVKDGLDAWNNFSLSEPTQGRVLCYAGSGQSAVFFWNLRD